MDPAVRRHQQTEGATQAGGARALGQSWEHLGREIAEAECINPTL